MPPNDVDRELFRLLKDIGVIRAYVGIETNSDEGIVSLNRRITSEDNRRALRLLDELDVYCSFNVLIFDPEATLDGVEANLDFMEEMADRPFNFCRAEVYAGTPLRQLLEAAGPAPGRLLRLGLRDARAARGAALPHRLDRVRGAQLQAATASTTSTWGSASTTRSCASSIPRPGTREWHAGLRELSRDVGRAQRGPDALAPSPSCASTDPYDHAGDQGLHPRAGPGVSPRRPRVHRRGSRRCRREMEARIEARGGPLRGIGSARVRAALGGRERPAGQLHRARAVDGAPARAASSGGA